MRDRYIAGLLLAFVLPAALALANPAIDPFSGLSSILVLFSTLGIEAFIIAIILMFFDMAPGTVFVAFFLGNLVTFFFIFLPLQEAISNLLVAEIVIVGAEGSYIKFLSRFGRFQLESFAGLKWKTAFIVAAIGNAFSYYIGTTVRL